MKSICYSGAGRKMTASMIFAQMAEAEALKKHYESQIVSPEVSKKILAEYKMIKANKSTLSSMKRREIVYYVEKNQ